MNDASSIVSTSYAVGSVSGGSYVGGLVGYNSGAVSNSFATGSVSGSSDVGGLVAVNGGKGAVSTSYATGKVSGASNVGGLAAFNFGTISSSFWNITTSGLSTSAGGRGMTTAQMQTETNFTSATSANGNVNPEWNFTSIWSMNNGVTYPLLQGLPAPAVTANDAATTYERSAYRGGK